jgi:hypothetical protein
MSISPSPRHPCPSPRPSHSGAEAHPEVALFFYAFVIVGSFFAVNLFVGVVIDQFGRMKEEFEGSALLTKDQQQWYAQATDCNVAYTLSR